MREGRTVVHSGANQGRGQYYAEHIRKAQLTVLIATDREYIWGKIFLTPGYRLKDEMNGEGRFVAISEVRVGHDIEGTACREVQFMALNKDYIRWIVPQEAVLDREEEGHL